MKWPEVLIIIALVVLAWQHVIMSDRLNTLRDEHAELTQELHLINAQLRGVNDNLYEARIFCDIHSTNKKDK